MDNTVFITEFDLDDETSMFVSECCGCAVIDSGCCSTVNGVDWFNAYLDSLSENDRQAVRTYTCSTKYRFGDGDEVHAMQAC